MKKAKDTNGTAKPKKPRKAPASAHKLAPRMPEGTVLTDLMKTQWKIGKPIGSGGFGLIYLTQQNSASAVKDDAEFVLKIEPHENGPLFCELNFYQRVAKPDMIKEWMSKQSLKSLGVPKFIASGQHERDGQKYRFMVIQRFGTDLQKLFEENGKTFPVHTVFLLGLKLMDVLEYVHEKGYAHGDIKAANLLTGYKDPHQIYLIDFGLAFRFMPDGQHKDYKEDPRRLHDGTIEFTSRDAHKGVAPSRRGDMEILGYCMVQWLCQKLPWENNLKNMEYVRDQKIKYMSDIPSFLSVCLPDKSYPAELASYLTYVSKLKYDEEPAYDQCRQIFSQALKKLGHKGTDKLDFSLKGGDKVKPSSAKVNRKRIASPSSPEDEGHLEESPVRRRWKDESLPVDEEAAEPAAKVRKAGSSKSPRVSSAPRKPKPAGPIKASGRVDVNPADTHPLPNPVAIATRKSKSPGGRGGRTTGAARAKPVRVVSSIATQTSPGLRGLRRGRRSR